MKGPETDVINNPFEAHASKGYAWALINQVGDSAALNRELMACLVRAQTWIAHATLDEELDLSSRKIGPIVRDINRCFRKLIDSCEIGDQKYSRLNPANFDQQREAILGNDLAPAIARTILLARSDVSKQDQTPSHPVLDKVDSIFEHINNLMRCNVPLPQQAILLILALSGEHGYNPHKRTGMKALNKDSSRKLFNRLGNRTMPSMNGNDFSKFLAPHPDSEKDDHWYVATPALIEFLGGQKAIDDLKGKILDSDGNFPVPMHSVTVEELETLGQEFIEANGGKPPPPPPPPPNGLETYGLDPEKTYMVTSKSYEPPYRYRALHGDQLRLLTIETIQYAFNTICRVFDAEGLLPVDIQRWLKTKDGPRQVLNTLAQKNELNPSDQEVLVISNPGQRLSSTIVKIRADALTDYKPS